LHERAAFSNLAILDKRTAALSDDGVFTNEGVGARETCAWVKCGAGTDAFWWNVVNADGFGTRYPDAFVKKGSNDILHTAIPLKKSGRAWWRVPWIKHTFAGGCQYEVA
jgi:hypothetical protein